MTISMIAIRPAVPADVNFIFATALRNAWYNKDTVTTLSKDKYMSLKHFEVEKNLDLYQTFVACLSDEPDVILGYIINTPLPFVYVKKAWRTAGVETTLLQALHNFNEKVIKQ